MIARRFEKYLGDFVFGAIDGTVTTFAVVAAAVGAGMSPLVVIILGAANLIGDGFSMGAGAYLSSKSERDLKIRNRQLVEGEKPIIDGVVTFSAFLSVGFVAILIYVFNEIFSLNIDKNALFIISMSMTGLSFIGIGLLKARVTKTSRVRSAIETLILGAIAAVLAYLLGFVLETVLKA